MNTHDHVSQDCSVCAGELQGKLDAALLQISEAKEENINLREAIREEQEKNAVISRWLVEEGDKLKETKRQIDEMVRDEMTRLRRQINEGL